MIKKKKIVPTRIELFDDFIETDGKKITPAVPTTKKSEVKDNELDTSGWFDLAERKPRRIPMTFTLEPQVIELIEKAADKHKLSRSRVIEKIALKTLLNF